MSAPIVITVPTKYIPINLAPLAIKTEPSPSSPLSDADESTSSMDEFLVRGKKRRLDHLTWEEKLQRKKLKNRVAAQTSRDRKKAKMEDMEQTIQQQTEQISELQLKCASLQSEKDAYYSKCLDLETRQEELERRLNELQQQIQMTTTVKSEPAMARSLTQCWLCFHPTRISSIRQNPSAAGNYFNGSTDDTESGHDQPPTDRRRKSSSTVEDNCSLPALQDMLEDFDVSKLEELAESLLANVTSELEGIDRGSSPIDAEDASAGCGMLGPVVGTPSEQLESSEETNQGGSLILTTHNYSKSPFHVEKPHSIGQQSDLDRTQSTVYGTYDDETNCITIVLNSDDNDEELPLEEEIICEETEDDYSTEEQVFKVKLEPVRELLSPIPSTCSNYSSSDEAKPAFDDDEPQQLFKCPLTPRSFVSDGGYESLGSPNGSTDFSITTSSLDDFWNLDLFPILN
ncbi:LOW QUALITY PROTEIN: uncharacterized protein LOC134227436 [Armigeres subalbatus]|uniref:LOW QUALITY PROTEIN: uncharacterized protein LOC134227436 n=1 Tax=Armigeres subalbatus TaxID=124917 RepID=UPI002ED36FFB